jgi:hypothetical protein
MTTDGYTYPIWADVLGNLANGITVLSMVAFAMYKIYQTVFKQKEPLKSAFKPASTWIPLRLKDRVFANMLQFKDCYTKRDEGDNYVWPTSDEQISKQKDKDKTKVLFRNFL